MNQCVAMIGMNLSVTGCMPTRMKDIVKARFQAAKALLLFGPTSRKVSGYSPMATVWRPPLIAFSEPIRGSLLLVSQAMSLGSTAGPLGAGAGAGASLAVSAERAAPMRERIAPPKRSVADRLFIFMA